MYVVDSLCAAGFNLNLPLQTSFEDLSVKVIKSKLGEATQMDGGGQCRLGTGVSTEVCFSAI